MHSENTAKIAINAAKSRKFEPLIGTGGRWERAWEQIYRPVQGWRDFVHA